MRRIPILFSLAVVVATVVMTVTSTLATNPHWVNDPSCAQIGLTVECSGKAAGLGNDPLFVVVEADGGCSNQDGTHVIPGHSVSVSGPFNTTNGNFTFGPGTRNRVTVSGPTCRGRSQSSFVTLPAELSIWSCASGSPTFSRKTGAQTNSNCTRVLGPTSA